MIRIAIIIGFATLGVLALTAGAWTPAGVIFLSAFAVWALT